MLEYIGQMLKMCACTCDCVIAPTYPDRMIPKFCFSISYSGLLIGSNFIITAWWSCFALSGKYAQVTNNPENDGCINAVLLVWGWKTQETILLFSPHGAHVMTTTRLPHSALQINCCSVTAIVQSIPCIKVKFADHELYEKLYMYDNLEDRKYWTISHDCFFAQVSSNKYCTGKNNSFAI